MMVRVAAVAGVFGPVLFVTSLVALSAVQYDFMLRIGWRPIADPAGAWPRGLALGPYGWVQDLNFALSGVLLAVFAVGLPRGMKDGSKTGPVFLFVAGAAMSLMASGGTS